MKIVYISFINESIRPGYVKKIHNQCAAFSNLGCKTWLISRDNECIKTSTIESDSIVLYDTYPVKSYGNGLLKYTSYFFALNSFFNYCFEMIERLVPDIVYIRRIRPITPKMLRTINRIRNNGTIVLYEYPTYPWKEDMILEKQYFSYAIDSLLFNSLQRRINALVCMGHCESMACDVIETINGIKFDISSIANRKLKDPNIINLICVCHYSPVHGLEKVVKGLASYYSKDQSVTVRLMIVGPIEDFSPIITLSSNLNVYKYIDFYGFLSGNDLEDLYSIADIGIDAIALELRGEKCVCGSLKSREYISKGIPFVCSDMLDIVYNSVDKPNFVYILNHNKTELDINDLVDWYSLHSFSNEEIINYGKDYLSWEKTMLPVVDYCNNKIAFKEN